MLKKICDVIGLSRNRNERVRKNLGVTDVVRVK